MPNMQGARHTTDPSFEGVSASVVVGMMNAPPVLEPAKHILDFVALAVKRAVIRVDRGHGSL